ncbi:hypothetical protein NYS50_11055 [Curtobacterium flaccumfaciens pv. flaccumfaciens]|uniref:tetratricopeptide repeat protein n=1 Tax=Curtobacterium flaccumfaciens TaxID=2035 RepID=UPI00217E21B9|nr:hypothetical protein [Curtobacterium flaccumfaciens]MCS6548417.1 hypothetical protein [Curtobacterium flaccumfaciens pv. flaccumfaciens]
MRKAVAEGFETELISAQRAVASARTTTSLARLAQAHESMQEDRNAVQAANDVLLLASAPEAPLDPFAVRIALEILLRNNDVDGVARYAAALPIDDTTRLVLGAAFAELGRYGTARELLEAVSADDRAAVVAYLLLSEGDDRGAIPLLRHALRTTPGDAESAHNLSIAFSRTGAHRKALAMALRATRANPGRQDISLHYLQLLLDTGDPVQMLAEADRLLVAGVQATPGLMVMQARAELELGHTERGEYLLANALKRIDEHKEPAIFAEVQSNLLRIRAVTGHARRDTVIATLIELSERYPEHSIVVSNLAQASNKRRHAAALAHASERSWSFMPEHRRAYISFQIAQLEGRNDLAAVHAAQWAAAEPHNPRAISSAIVALGIGVERWEEAVAFAEPVLASDNADPVLVNNAAYVYAMAGRSQEAIDILTPYARVDSTLKATLGLAYLAAGETKEGLRVYREAAKSAGSKNHIFLSLISLYQALVVRQLGIDIVTDSTQLAAQSLAPVGLPDDWEQRPEFLRLKWVAGHRGYHWPMTL